MQMFSFFASRLGVPSTSSSSSQIAHQEDSEQVDADDVSSSGRSLSLPWPVTESRAKQPQSLAQGLKNSFISPSASTTASTSRRDFTSNTLSPPLTRGTAKNVVISNPIPRTHPNHLAAALTPPPHSTPLPSVTSSTLPGYNQASDLPRDQGLSPPPLHQPQPRLPTADTAEVSGAFEYERTPSRRGHYPQPRFEHRQAPGLSIPPSGSYIPYAPPEVVRLDSSVGDSEDTVVGELNEGDPSGEGVGKPRKKKPRSTSPYAYSPPTRPYEYTSNPSASSYALPIPDEAKSIGSIKSTSSAKSTSTAASVASTATSLKRHLTISNPLQHFTSSKKSPTSPELYLSPFNTDERDNATLGAQRTHSYSETPSVSNASSRSEFHLDASKLDAFPPVPSSSPLGFITKSRWNMGLNTNLRVQTPGFPAKGRTARPQAIYEGHDEDEEEDRAQTPTPMPMPQNMPSMPPMPNGFHAHKKPVPVAVFPLNLDVPTDVYSHAYHYPLAKQLSPIAEQEYISPTTAAASDSQSLRFGHGGDSSSLRVDFEYPRTRKETNGSGTGSASARSISLKEKDVEKEKVKTNDSCEKQQEQDVPKEKKTRMGSGRSGSGGSIGTISDITRPSPIYTPTSASGASPFLTRHLNMNRTVSQTSSKSDGQQQVYAQAGQVPAANAATRLTSNLNTSSQNREVQTPTATVMTPVQQTPTSAATTTMFTPTSTAGVQTPIGTSMPKVGGSGPSANPYPIQIPAAAALSSKDTTIKPIEPPPEVPVMRDSAYQAKGSGLRLPKIPSLPTIPPLDLRFSVLGSVAPRRNSREVRPLSMPAIESAEEDASEESYEEDETEDEDEQLEEEDDDDYDHESLHADSFVTADGNEVIGLELIGPSTPRLVSASASSSRTNSLPAATPIGSSTTTGDSFIHRRWDREANLGFATTSSGPGSPNNATTFRAKAKDFFFSSYTPAFWTFWFGFLFPVLWLIGGWHFTNRGEMPPRYTVWEWYFWRRQSISKKGTESQATSPVKKTVSRKGSRLSKQSKGKKKARSVAQRMSGERVGPSEPGATSPALPRWIAERMSTDDGRLRRLTHDPKRSLRGISFGYPFVPRPPSDSSMPARCWNPFSFIFRVLDLLYGVKLREVHGRPESARRMFDPWIQRCRYALCLGMISLAVGMLVACVYLIVVVI